MSVSFSLAEIAEASAGRLHGASIDVSAVSTDTRGLRGGELFVALQGPRFDAHDFIAEAGDAGAAAVMVMRPTDTSLPTVEVEDTRVGLGRLAAAWRLRAAPRLIGVTGSNGKTTLKEMIAGILVNRGSLLATRGNLNNDIGLPLTLARLQGEKYAVIEMGANHTGEIDYLSRIAQPDVAVLNNAGRAHLEGFGSLEGVARAKAEIINGLKPEGLFVYNADDNFAGLWRDLAAGRRTRTFGTTAGADVRSHADDMRIEWVDGGFRMAFGVSMQSGSFEVSMRLVGEHNRMNALAAMAASAGVGADPADMQHGLAEIRPVPGRLSPRCGVGESLLIDDTYNANPDSVLAAIELLRTAPGERVLVLGDLAELGGEAPELMREIGASARDAGIDRLYTCGVLSSHAADAFGSGARHFNERQALVESLAGVMHAEQKVLVKGSRSAGMERVVAALVKEGTAC